MREIAADKVRLRVAAMLFAVCCLAGCAGSTTDTGRSTSSGTPTGTTSLSGPAVTTTPVTVTTAPPGASTRPSVPPSDEITGVWVPGTIGTDSAGPCYQLRADDGRVITLYSSRAGSLAAGERIRARMVTPVTPIYCGSTEALRLLEVKPAV